MTHDEPVLLAAPKRKLCHGYEGIGERLGGVHLATSSLEMIVAEKLRACCKTNSRCKLAVGTARPRPGSA